MINKNPIYEFLTEFKNKMKTLDDCKIDYVEVTESLDGDLEIKIYIKEQ